MEKVLITQADWDIERFFKEALSLLQEKAEVVLNRTDKTMSVEDVISISKDVDVIITGWGGCSIKPEILEQAGSLKLVAVLGGAIGSHSPEIAFEKGIRFCHCPKAIGRYVAEFTMGLILSMCYELPWHDELIKKKKNKNIPEGAYHEKDGWLARGLRKSTVGILGSGSIARHMVNYLIPYECKILMCDPHLTDEDANALGVEKVDLKALMKQSEILTIHAAWTKETTRIISKDLLAMLTDGALVVNTARMPIIDEEALLSEVKSNRLRACLNLIPFNEIWFDSQLENARNVYLSSGNATVADKTLSDMGNMLTADIVRFIDGKEIVHEVTRAMLDKMT